MWGGAGRPGMAVPCRATPGAASRLRSRQGLPKRWLGWTACRPAALPHSPRPCPTPCPALALAPARCTPSTRSSSLSSASSSWSPPSSPSRSPTSSWRARTTAGGGAHSSAAAPRVGGLGAGSRNRVQNCVCCRAGIGRGAWEIGPCALAWTHAFLPSCSTIVPAACRARSCSAPWHFMHPAATAGRWQHCTYPHAPPRPLVLAPAGIFIYAYCFYYYHARSDMSGLLQNTFYFGYVRGSGLSAAALARLGRLRSSLRLAKEWAPGGEGCKRCCAALRCAGPRACKAAMPGSGASNSSAPRLHPPPSSADGHGLPWLLPHAG